MANNGICDVSILFNAHLHGLSLDVPLCFRLPATLGSVAMMVWTVSELLLRTRGLLVLMPVAAAHFMAMAGVMRSAAWWSVCMTEETVPHLWKCVVMRSAVLVWLEMGYVTESAIHHCVPLMGRTVLEVGPMNL